jgi:4-amino-4-deoxy-L-arabinose transferase-like glycosyltransferase
LIVPVAFFSFSQSKLPGYILPAVPAGAILLADYLRQRLETETPAPKWMALVHALVACAPLVPAALVGYIVSGHRMFGGPLFWIALAVALGLSIGVALTLIGRLYWLRFVTLIPVVLAVAAVLKLGTFSIDERLSTRPLANALASMETQKLPIAVCGASREVEYGLAFYRDQIVARYESGNVPAHEHLLVAPPTWKANVNMLTSGRRLTFLGHYAPQNLDYYWVGAPAPTKR